MALKMIDFFFKRYNPIKYWKKKGVRIGENCRLLGNPDLGTEPYLIEIGNHVSISAGTKLITHEGAHWVLKGLDKKYNRTFGFGRIIIGDNVYIGENVTILRGVTIGDNCIIGACSLVNKSCEKDTVYAGVPAKRICSLEEWKSGFLADMPDYDRDNFEKNKRDEIEKIVDKFRRR